ncbi:MAG: hypothetical protein AABY22_21495 [Nanoarchaeota archaeon]
MKTERQVKEALKMVERNIKLHGASVGRVYAHRTLMWVLDMLPENTPEILT